MQNQNAYRKELPCEPHINDRKIRLSERNQRRLYPCRERSTANAKSNMRTRCAALTSFKRTTFAQVTELDLLLELKENEGDQWPSRESGSRTCSNCWFPTTSP